MAGWLWWLFSSEDEDSLTQLSGRGLRQGHLGWPAALV